MFFLGKPSRPLIIVVVSKIICFGLDRSVVPTMFSSTTKMFQLLEIPIERFVQQSCRMLAGWMKCFVGRLLVHCCFDHAKLGIPVERIEIDLT